MGDIIIILAVAAGLVFAVLGTVKRSRNGCCGGSVPKAAPKKPDGEIIGKKEILIEGMHCENCRNRVESQINRIDGAVAKVSLKRKTAVVSMTRPVTDEELIRAVERADFKVVRITECGKGGKKR